MKLLKHILLPVLVLCLLAGILPVGALSGDANGDNAVDLNDAKYYLYHIMLPASYPLADAGDYNGDGIISSADAIYLMYHTLVPEDYPLFDSVTLPAVGYDPDGKGRIQLAEVHREGGTVYATFENKSKSWETDETSTISYTCTDAEGNVLLNGSFYLGYVKCGKTTTGAITLPEGTAAIAFTGCDISYWGVWK